jgi:hypothetical protein
MSKDSSGTSTDPLIRWLLNGDPAIRWQTMRDLAGASGLAVKREQRKIARDGWGARLLAEQDRSGRWAAGKSGDGGLYSPKWTSTTYTMLLLRDFGLPADNPQARKACKLLLNEGLQPDGGINYGVWAKWTKRSETCVTGMVLSLLSHFEYDDPRLENHCAALVGAADARRRMELPPRGRRHAPLGEYDNQRARGLEAYELCRGHKVREVRAAQRRAREFLLVHRLFRSHRSGEVIKPAFVRFAFPPRWRYDILRALDYFQAVDAPRDARLSEAIDIVRDARREDGRWPLQHTYKGKTYFEMERVGAPSRWNTLRSLRVMRWWDRVA